MRTADVKETVLVLAGAAIGGVLGYMAFFWMARQGFYGMVLPGGLLGIGASFGKPRSIWPAAFCGAAALGLGLFTEWRFAPFQQDPGFGFFLRHIAALTPLTLLMIGLGGVLGFWVPFRRVESQKSPRNGAGQTSLP